MTTLCDSRGVPYPHVRGRKTSGVIAGLISAESESREEVGASEGSISCRHGTKIFHLIAVSALSLHGIQDLAEMVDARYRVLLAIPSGSRH